MKHTLANLTASFLLAGVAFTASMAPAADARLGSFVTFDARAKAGERLNVVFFGASLTWGANATDPQLTSYRALVGQRLEQRYPNAHFRFWDAAIGGTGSQLGLFRLERDCLKRKPDLVFVDFSANDDIHSATPETLASYEAIVRRLVNQGIPVVQVVFPFKWNVAAGKLDDFKRRDAHHAISKAYHTPIGDAIELAQRRVREKATTLDELWPVDGVHPGDVGYALFADAAWDAFVVAVEKKQVCKSPEKMLHADTYMTSSRTRISSLGPLPAGWKVGRPNVVSAYFDMLMSRWLDDEVVARPAKVAAASPAIGRLRFRFTGSMAMLFGESTPASGKYRAYIDGKLVQKKSDDGKSTQSEFDAGHLGRLVKGNTHLAQVIAEGLDPAVEHTLEIEAVLNAEQELRIESICVAGGTARVIIASE